MTAEQIQERLTSKYINGRVQVVDLTGTSSNFEVRVASEQFSGKSRIQCHKEVMAVFSEELASGEIHAF